MVRIVKIVRGGGKMEVGLIGMMTICLIGLRRLRRLICPPDKPDRPDRQDGLPYFDQSINPKQTL